eukprot:TRINITY_DN19811_c1_g1_i1.p1 TRINITY_DN19811_c1_g1~~TRINITY_DN19811_c1_g1_i1.p1  ORF type:complete len:886 (-),score=221.61 TRINITY_DN19811_c1_g1_i1:59-2716(-)
MVKVAPEEVPETHRTPPGPGRQSITVQGVNIPYQEEESPSIVVRLRRGIRTLYYNSGWYDSAVAARLRKILKRKEVAAVTLVGLFAALFLRELCIIAQAPNNTLQDTVLTVVLIVFCMEFLGLVLTDTTYVFGFFFWMDLMGNVSLIADISYFGLTDATEVDEVNFDSGRDASENVIVVRVARAAKLGARAGRLTRVLKILRYLPFLVKSRDKEINNRAKMSKVISMQLTNVLSTRVAFLSICVVVVMPIFDLFTYPEMDDSMSTWVRLLNRNVATFVAMRAAGNSSELALQNSHMLSELSRFSQFYSRKTYGPIEACLRVGADFTCGVANLPLSTNHPVPARKSSIRQVNEELFQASFTLAQPKREEAAAAIGLVVFICLVMLFFGLLMSNSIGVVALQPLERMLFVVRERCAQIFKYTDELNDEEEDEDNQPEEYDDCEHSSEFALLEKVVSKLAAIVNLTAAGKAPEVKSDMNENDIMVLNWMQGSQVNNNSGTHRKSEVRASVGEGPGGTARLEPLSEGSCLPGAVLEALGTEDFNSCDITKDMRVAVANYYIVYYEGSSQWVSQKVPQQCIQKFTTNIESRYKDNSFHNFAHGLDVTYTVCRWMRLIEADDFLSDYSQFLLLVAAIAHDVGHLGVNNQYLIESSHELAVKYNDRSPLENMHCAMLFQVISDPECNIFGQLDKELYKEIRKGIIAVILHTDVTKHNEMVKDLGMLYQMNSEAFDDLNPGAVISVDSQANSQLALNCLLHGADVNNPMKPWELCEKLAQLMLDEFFAQGDLEKAKGMPVQMLNDREKVNRANSQIGFIEFLIAPFVEAKVLVFPQLDRLATNLGNNIQQWYKVWQAEAGPSAEAVSKAGARVEKVRQRLQMATRVERGIRLK